MTECSLCYKPAKHLSVRIPFSPDAPIEVEHECQTYGCKAYMKTWMEEARDVEAVLRAVFEAQGCLVT